MIRWERGRSGREWDVVTWLMVVLAVLAVILILSMWVLRVWFPVGCEPAFPFPDLQLPTLGLEP